jgi:hypothetical protein
MQEHSITLILSRQRQLRRLKPLDFSQQACYHPFIIHDGMPSIFRI